MVHPAQVFPQDLQGRMTVAATSVSALQRWGTLVERMVRDRELVVRVAYNDRLLPDHSHETLSQYYENVPVYGGQLMIHRTRGVAVSILGSIYRGIDLETTPTLSAEQAGEIIERVSGSTNGPALPTLTIFPMLFRGYALTYMATTSNAMTYVLDAHDGHIRLEYSEKRNQTSSCRPGASNCAVGVGVGVLGDQKKIGSSHKCMHDLAPGRSASAVGRRCGCARARYAAVQSSVAQLTAACAGPALGGGPARRQPDQTQAADSMALTWRRTVKDSGTRPRLSPMFCAGAERSLTVQPPWNGQSVTIPVSGVAGLSGSPQLLSRYRRCSLVT